MIFRHAFSSMLRAANSLWVLTASVCLVQMASPGDAKSLDLPSPGSGSAVPGEVTDAINADDLRLKQEKVRQASAVQALPSQPQAAAMPSPEAALFSRSLLLGEAGQFTLLPLGSILCLPAAHRGKLLEQPSGSFLNWQDFLKANQAWLATREVTMTMARGKDQKITAKLLRELERETRAVVAVFKGNPISMMEPASQSTDQAPK